MVYYRREGSSIDSLLKKEAIKLIYNVFKSKRDNGGNPYSRHLITVMQKVEGFGEDIEVSALLHDIVEDTEITLEDLKEIGFNKDILDMVNILTRRKYEVYNLYLDRVLESNNYGALVIKRADLEDNMDLSRLQEITIKDIRRLETRYIPAWKKINKKIKDLEKIK